jgi:hypothetical protein
MNEFTYFGLLCCSKALNIKHILTFIKILQNTQADKGCCFVISIFAVIIKIIEK